MNATQRGNKTKTNQRNKKFRWAEMGEHKMESTSFQELKDKQWNFGWTKTSDYIDTGTTTTVA